MAVSKKRKEEIRKSIRQMGVDATAEMYGLTRETVRRYNRKDALVEEVLNEDVFEPNKMLQKIGEMYSEKELKLLANGGIPLHYKHTPLHDFDGKTVKVGYLTDTHIGSIYTDTSYIDDAREEFAKEGVEFVVHVGDVTEGMSHRPGHIYECSELGYDAQKSKAIDVFSAFDFCPIYMIDGNHDRWYIKSNGALIVKDICEQVDSAVFLGHDEADIQIGENASLKLWHGEDGSSYAISYRLQKLVESLTGGEKPSVMFCGHVHKFGHFFIRHIQCVSAGCIQKQSKWMRGKKIEAHTGFGIAEMTVNEKGVGKFSNTFYPFYT